MVKQQERLPSGMRVPGAVTYVRCTECEAAAELLLDDQYVRRAHPGASLAVLQVMPDVAFPPAGCDVVE